MITIDTLKQLLNDQELREQVSRLINNKIQTDLLGLRASAELSKHLLGIQRQQAADREQQKRLVRELLKEHLDYYGTLINLTQGFNNSLLSKLAELEGGTPHAADTPATLEIEAPLNSVVRAPFRLGNNSDAPISVGFESTPFVSEDGSKLVSVATSFDPPAVEIKPGEEAQVDLIVPVDEEFSSDTTYYATISVSGIESMQVVVKLKVVEAPEIRTETDQAKPAPSKKKMSKRKRAAPKQAAGTLGKKGTRKKGVGKKRAP